MCIFKLLDTNEADITRKFCDEYLLFQYVFKKKYDHQVEVIIFACKTKILFVLKVFSVFEENTL